MKVKIESPKVDHTAKYPLLAEDSGEKDRVALFKSEYEGIWITGSSAGMLVFNANINKGFNVLPVGAQVILQQD